MSYGATPTPEQQAAIESRMNSFAAAVAASDWDAALAEYTEDAVIMPPNTAPLVGRPAIRAWAEALPPIASFEWENHEIMIFGDVAVIRGTYRMTMTIPGAPEPVLDVGSYLEVRHQQADGRWLLARDVFNTDLPLPE